MRHDAATGGDGSSAAREVGTRWSSERTPQDGQAEVPAVERDQAQYDGRGHDGEREDVDPVVGVLARVVLGEGAERYDVVHCVPPLGFGRYLGNALGLNCPHNPSYLALPSGPNQWAFPLVRDPRSQRVVGVQVPPRTLV